MISVFQDKLSMELGYSMKYIFTEDQYGGLYERSKRGDTTALMTKIF